MTVEECNGPAQITLWELARVGDADASFVDADGGGSSVADPLGTSTTSDADNTCATLAYAFRSAGTYLIQVDGYGWLRIE